MILSLELFANNSFGLDESSGDEANKFTGKESLDNKASKFTEKEPGSKQHLHQGIGYKYIEVTRRPGMVSYSKFICVNTVLYFSWKLRFPGSMIKL